MLLQTRDLAYSVKKIQRKICGSGITLTNNENKYIIKLIKSLENRGILIKGTPAKITGQEGGFLNFLRTLITASLPLMKKCTDTTS